MLPGIGDAKTQHHFVDERRLRDIEIQTTKISTRVKHQLINTRRKRIPLENRIIESPIGIAVVTTQFPQFRGHSVNHYFNTSRGTTVRRIQNMCCQPPHIYTPQQ